MLPFAFFFILPAVIIWNVSLGDADGNEFWFQLSADEFCHDR